MRRGSGTSGEFDDFDYSGRYCGPTAGQPALMRAGGATWEDTNLLISFMLEQEGFVGYVRLRRCVCLFGFRDEACKQMAMNNMDLNGAVQVIREEDVYGDSETAQAMGDEQEPDA